MTSDGTNSYVWNARNQLASMDLNAVSFQYDALGRRTAKTISGTTTSYLYDGLNIDQELSGITPVANLLTGSIDEVFTRADSSGTASFLSDALGSTLALTNSSGSSLVQYGYDPFGNTFVTSGVSANSYQYTGRENDGTGVYFYRGRFYNPTFQRFISEDPIGIVGGINLYAYVGNNPTNFRDPLGFDRRGPRCGGWCMTALGAAGIAAIVLTDGLAAPAVEAAGEALEAAAVADEAGAAGEGLITLFHGTDFASATNIVQSGLDVSQAAELGGGDVFWTTQSAQDAAWFAQANPAGGIPAIVGMTIPEAVASQLSASGLLAVEGSVYTFESAAWSILNEVGSFSIVP